MSNDLFHELPPSWAMTTISDIAEINPRLDKSEIADDLEVAFVPMSAVEAETGLINVNETRYFKEVKKGYTPFVEGDVLFAKITPCMENGKMAVVPELPNALGFGSTEFHVLRLYHEIDPQFLYYFVSSQKFRFDAEHHMTGAVGQRRVPTSYLAEHPICIPPLNEQRRIVAKIEELFSELDNGVESLEKAREQLRIYRQALLKHAVEGRLTERWREAQGESPQSAADLLKRILAERRERWEAEAWQKEIERAQKKAAQARRKAAGRPHRIRDMEPEEWLSLTEEEYTPYLPKDDRWKSQYEEPQPPDTEGLPELPEGWVWARVEQLGNVIGGLTKNRKRQKLPLQLPYLRVANVYADELRLDDVQEVGVEEHELERLLLEEHDVLVVEGNGSADQIGRVAVWNGSIDPCVHQNHLIKVRLVFPQVATFVLYWLLSVKGREEIVRVASSTSGLYTLSLSKVAALPVPLAPLPEQQRIAEEVERQLSLVAELEATVEGELSRAERLRQSILKQAFSGKLVPQDPDDEAAPVLLARIRAAREEAATGKSEDDPAYRQMSFSGAAQ